MDIIELDKTKPIERVEEYEYIEKITSYHCTDNEIWLGCEVMDEDTFETVYKTIVFNALDVLNSGLCDKDHIKDNITKFISKL